MGRGCLKLSETKVFTTAPKDKNKVRKDILSTPKEQLRDWALARCLVGWRTWHKFKQFLIQDDFGTEMNAI